MAHSHSSQLEEGHGGIGGYVAGFILSVLLTGSSFGLVKRGAEARREPASARAMCVAPLNARREPG